MKPVSVDPQAAGGRPTDPAGAAAEHLLTDGTANGGRGDAQARADGHSDLHRRADEEGRFSAILDAATDAIINIGDGGLIEWLNPAAEQLFSYESGELVGRNVSVLMPSPYRDEHDRHLARHQESGRSRIIGISREVLGQRRDGTTFVLELAVSETRVGERRTFTGFIRDVTDRRRAEKALWRSEARNRALVNAIPDMLFRLSRDGTYLDFKPSKDIVPLVPPSNFLGKKIAEVLSPELAARCMAYMEKAFASGETEVFEYDLPMQDVVHDFECRILPSGEEEAIAIVRDITERKQADEALHRSQRDFRQLIEKCPDGVAIHRSRRFLYVNHAFAFCLGYTANEMVGMAVMDVLHPEEQEPVERRIREQEAMLRPPAVPRETRYVRRDGTVIQLQVVPADATVEFEGRPAMLVFTRDLTQVRKMEAQLYLADRMASVGTLAAGMAHEINNPLAYITTNLRFLGEELGAIARTLPEDRLAQMEEAVRDAQEGAERVRRIVRHLKTFSRGEDEHRVLVDVRRVIDSAINVAWNEIRHRARLVKDFADVPPVEANEARLGQVFLNLVMNAAQAIPEGEAEKNEIRIATRREDGDRVSISMRDTGAGIPAGIRDRLFDPFFTTKPVGVGTGLGLSICHGIVTALGGEIAFESEIGKGTTFRVVLPAAQLEHRESGTQAATGVSARRGRILVVDDETMILVSLRRLLGPEHDVATATSAREALDRLNSGERFDVILCDLMMPEMTGMDLHAEIFRASPRDADRMVFFTGGAFTPRARAFLDEVPNQRVEKPFDGQTLRLLVQSMLR